MKNRFLFILLAALLGAGPAYAAPECPDSDAARHFNLINMVRAQKNLPAFRRNPTLDALAAEVATDFARGGEQKGLTPEQLEARGYKDPNMLSQIVFSSKDLRDDYVELGEATSAIVANETTDIGLACFAMEGYYPTRVVLQARKVTDLTLNDVPRCADGFEQEIMTLTNTYRRSKGLGEVRWDGRLAAAAQVQADYMAHIDSMQHEGPNGSRVADRVMAQGYEYSIVSENVASGQESPARAMTSWKNSPGHNKNLLQPEVTHIGAACANPKGVAGKAMGKHHVITWAQVFGALR